jgi:hypothetical protein
MDLNGLKWTEKIDSKIIKSNKPGSDFKAKRVSKDQPLQVEKLIV